MACAKNDNRNITKKMCRASYITIPFYQLSLKGGLRDSAHVHETKYCFSPVHGLASTQASSFNCIVNEPIGSELIAWV